MNRLTKITQHGFTIVELLIVMAVLAVLGTGLIIMINPAQQIAKANDSRRKSELRYISNLLNLYYNDHGQYPQAHNSKTTNCTNGTTPQCYVFSSDNVMSGTLWIDALAPYAKTLPVDPVNSGDPRTTGLYGYAYGGVSSDGQHYDLITQLQNVSDPSTCANMSAANTPYMYNYGFGSPISWCGSNSPYIFQLNHE